MKYLGYIIQAVCIIFIYHGEVLRKNEILRYTICFVAIIYLLWNIYVDFKNSHK